MNWTQGCWVRGKYSTSVLSSPPKFKQFYQTAVLKGSGCGTVCRAIPSLPRDPRFEPYKNFWQSDGCVNSMEKTKVKKYCYSNNLSRCWCRYDGVDIWLKLVLWKIKKLGLLSTDVAASHSLVPGSKSQCSKKAVMNYWVQCSEKLLRKASIIEPSKNKNRKPLITYT